MAAPVPKKEFYRLEKIDTVPGNYYPLTTVLKTEPIHYTDGQIYKIRYFSMHKMVDRMKSVGEIDFRRFWYEKVNGTMADKSIGSDTIFFGKVMQLAPIVHCIEAFTTTVSHSFKEPKKKRKNIYIYVSFGIRKDLFQQYFKSGCTVIPYIERIMIEDPYSNFRRTKIRADENPKGNSFVKAPETPILRRWKDWCKLTNSKQYITILEAMKLQMDENPVDGLPPLEKYMENQEFFIPDTSGENKEKIMAIKVNIPWETANQMEVIIKNYNSDPNNIEKLSKTDYVSKAVQLLNSNMDLRYSNPKLYEQYMKKQFKAKTKAKENTTNKKEAK